jgi:hypothetical protein
MISFLLSFLNHVIEAKISTADVALNMCGKILQIIKYKKWRE